jgi:hypothetical protein
MARVAKPRDTGQQRLVEVHVAPGTHGGWDVIAMLGSEILATQHCSDWHRAERVYKQMRDEARFELPAAV